MLRHVIIARDEMYHGVKSSWRSLQKDHDAKNTFSWTPVSGTGAKWVSRLPTRSALSSSNTAINPCMFIVFSILSAFVKLSLFCFRLLPLLTSILLNSCVDQGPPIDNEIVSSQLGPYTSCACSMIRPYGEPSSLRGGSQPIRARLIVPSQ